MGRSVSPENKHKISIANKGRIVSSETRSKISIGNKGKHKEPRTLETKVKMAEVARKQWSNPESRAKKLIGMRKRKNNEKE